MPGVNLSVPVLAHKATEAQYATALAAGTTLAASQIGDVTDNPNVMLVGRGPTQPPKRFISEAAIKELTGSTVREITADATANVGELIMLPTGVSLTLPASPEKGDVVAVLPTGDLVANPATIIASKIMGDDSGSYPFDINVGLRFVWTDAAYGWGVI